MDKLADTLRSDAAKIDVEVSQSLDERIRASLEGIAPQPVRARPKPHSMWWASGLTGVTAVAAIVLVVNLRQPEGNLPDESAFVTPDPAYVLDLNAETAVLTAPLVEELENLEADLRKAEQSVKEEIGFSL